MTSAPDRRRWVDALLMALFVGALLAPWCDQILRSDEARGPLTEQRAPAEKPPPPTGIWTLQAYPGLYESYYRDRYGLRDVLLRWHSVLKLFLLGVSPTSQVEIGTDDWMYYTGERSIETFRGLNPFAPDELEQWRTELEKERDWLTAHGIAWLFVLGPNKETIYPEKLRSALSRVGPTRFDLLDRHLREHSDVRLLDLRPGLIAARRVDDMQGPLYYPLGTHWTGRGNFEVYRQIISALPARLLVRPRIEPDDAVFFEGGGESDSWARMMYLASSFPQAVTYGTRRSQTSGRQTAFVNAPHASFTFENDGKNLPRALMFHDSFGSGLMGWLSEHFSVMKTVQSNTFDTGLILAEKPDVVLLVYVERSLCATPPVFVDVPGAAFEQRAFEDARDVRFQLLVERDPPQLTALGNTSVLAILDEDAIAIETNSPADTALLDPFEPGAGAHALRIEITAPQDTFLDLFYQPIGESAWQNRNHVEVALPRGRSAAWFILDAAINGRLRIRPGREPGRYVLHALEVRALAR